MSFRFSLVGYVGFVGGKRSVFFQGMNIHLTGNAGPCWKHLLLFDWVSCKKLASDMQNNAKEKAPVLNPTKDHQEYNNLVCKYARETGAKKT